MDIQLIVEAAVSVWLMASFWCWITGGHVKVWDHGWPVCRKCGAYIYR